jgi:hypothetical protein
MHKYTATVTSVYSIEMDEPLSSTTDLAEQDRVFMAIVDLEKYGATAGMRIREIDQEFLLEQQ